MNLVTPHIMGEIYNRPLLVTAEKLTAILDVLNQKNGGHLDLDIAGLAPFINAEKMDAPAKAYARPMAESEDEFVEVLGVIGSLIPRNRGFSDSSGLRSYRTLIHEIELAVKNPATLGLVLDVDSYGGTAQGCARAAQAIREASLQKPIYAFVDMNAYSAATWLATACSKVILSDVDAGMGSVGCIAIHKELSRRAELEGDTYTIKHWGANKADFNPVQPLSGDLADKLDRSVTKLGLNFAQAVASFRNIDLQQVIDMEAACFYGQDAIDIGLADEIASFADTCAMVAEAGKKHGATSKGLVATNSKGQGGTPMSLTEQFHVLLEQEGAEHELASVLSEKGFITQALADESTKVAVEQAVEQAQQESAESVKAAVGNFSAALDLAAMASLTVAEAKTNVVEAMGGESFDSAALGEALQATRAAKQGYSFTSTTTSSTTEVHPLLAAAQAKADAAKK